jgi:hypothetical protein
LRDCECVRTKFWMFGGSFRPTDQTFLAMGE